MNIYSSENNKGQRILDKETGEYVTSKDLFAQWFELSEMVRLKEISLALHKFGGDGAISLDILEDKNGKP